MALHILPSDKSQFTLDALGVAGVFGGDAAACAMATVHIYENRRWLGWYNSPGSYQIAGRYGHLANSRFFDGPFSGVHTDPTTLFGLDGQRGPRFRAAYSGTIIEETGHLAALFMKECAALVQEGNFVRGRKTQAIGVTLAELNHVPAFELNPRRSSPYTPFIASIPISVSIVSCVACGLFKDWYSFSSILLGILANGISCLAIGSGEFMFTHPEPAIGSPPGDGVLISDKHHHVVILRGKEGAVNSITRGRFSFKFSSESEYGNIEHCSFLLTIQFIAQLLLVPQGSLFGQVMFVTSLAVSWMYNSWLSSLDKEKIQRDILLDNVLQKPVLTKFILGTRTAMVVFVLLVLRLDEPNEMLRELLPNDTKVWRRWKEAVIRRLRFGEEFEFPKAEWDWQGFTQEEKDLLRTLFGDAQAAYRGYLEYCISKQCLCCRMQSKAWKSYRV